MRLIAPRNSVGNPCIICGAESGACQPGVATPGPTGVERDTDYEVHSDGRVVVDARFRYRMSESRWTSDREVLEPIAGGKFERRYAEGDSIPLLVALSQRQVHRKQLTDHDKVELKRHLGAGKITMDQLREALIAGG